MSMYSAKSIRKLGWILGLSIALQNACSENKFESARLTSESVEQAVQDSQDATAAKSSSGEGASSDQNAMPAQVETTEIGASKKPDTIINSFSASTTKDASFHFTLAPKMVSTDFTLEDNLSSRTDAFAQLNRKLTSESFKQGNAGQMVTQSFDQNARKGLVDILLVIDNSGSMSQEQVNLASKLNELLVSIKDANWQISVITTSPAGPAGLNLNLATAEGKELCNTVLIKSGDVDATNTFAKAVNAGTSGNGNEQGIRQAVVGLRCTEKPWVRPMSTLAVLIVSDEDNCSLDGKDCGTLPWAKEGYLTNYVENTLNRSIGKNAGFYGLVGPNKTLCPTAGNAATQYLRLFSYKNPTATNNYGNICDASYKTTLNRISDSIALLLDNQFELKSFPDTGSLKMNLTLADGSTVPADAGSFVQSGKVITFLAGKEPPAGSKVVTNYIVGAKPIVSSFTIHEDAAPGTLSVNVNGAVIPEGGYTLNGRTIAFKDVPAEMADITAIFRQNSALLDRFKPNALPLVESIKVKVNGVATTQFTYDAINGEVLLKSLPSDGQSVEITYLFREDPKLSYTLPVTKDGKNFKLYDQGTALSFTSNGNVFTIPAEAHKAGKILTLRYEVADGGTKAFELGRMPVLGSADIIAGQGGCDLGMGLDILDERLISTCNAATVMDFTLAYKYVEVLRSFQVKGIERPDIGTWSVYVDGELSKDFVREGSSISLASDPKLDSRIEIHYTFPE